MLEKDIVTAIMRRLKAEPACFAWKEHGGILPLSEGGTHDEQNLMALCKSCHSKITAGAGWSAHK